MTFLERLPHFGLKRSKVKFKVTEKVKNIFSAISHEHLTFEGQNKKIFFFEAISLKFRQMLPVGTLNEHAKFQNDLIGRLGLKADCIFRNEPIVHNGKGVLTKY